MGKRIDLTGQRFGRLTVEGYAYTDKNSQAIWHCVCDCGQSINVRAKDLRNGNTKSCGCIRSVTPITKYPRIYNSWRAMIDRCKYPSYKQYKDYGGRGIAVCAEWMEFEVFLDWALKSGYKDGLTIDRIDNNGDYSPENCRWVTRKVQNYNRRSNHLLEYKGKSKTVEEWAALFGMKRTTLERRLKLGWSIEKALETPIKKNTKHK